MNLTAPELAQATGARLDRAERMLPHLLEAMPAYDIDTPARAAAFLAQIGHESGGLRWLVELWGPTPTQLRYEGRADLGNTRPGDGFRFRGRGLIQTTGRHNYTRLRDRLRAKLGPDVPDFEGDPDRLAEPKWAAWSACDFWGMRGLNALADAGDFATLTRRINGGFTGMDDRLARWDQAKQVLA